MSAAALVPHRDGVVIRVWVVPGSSRTELAGSRADRLKLRVAVPAERGRANEEAAGLLSRVLGAPVELVSGARSREKSYLARGLSVAEAAGKLPV